MLNNITQQGGWSFEVKTFQSCKCCSHITQIFCRKTPIYGQPYSACAVITVTDGEPYLELMLNKHVDSFSRSDYRDFHRYLKSLGFKSAKFKRIKNNKTRDVTHFQ